VYRPRRMRRPWTLPSLLALLPALGLMLAVDAETARAADGGTDVGPGREPPPAVPGTVVRVPADAPTIQAAVDGAKPGGLVLVSPGVYREAVVVTTPFVTIRGADRNRVVLDGGFELDNGIRVIEADGVAIENMTARHYRSNGFVWSSVFGYRGSYLTAFDDGAHGLYAYESMFGQFDHSYASGHPDAGFSIARCGPCHAVVIGVIGERNAFGFGAVDASGDLSVVNSEWAHNMAGIMPNTFGAEASDGHDVLIAGNVVRDNDERDAPAGAEQYPAIGIGIGIGGGKGNVVEGNVVAGQERYGIAVFPAVARTPSMAPYNVVRDNIVVGSGTADLALQAPSARDCFERNDFATSLPPAIEWQFGCGSPLRLGGGDVGSAVISLILYVDTLDGRYPHGDWRTEQPPGPRAQMPAARHAPPDPAVAEAAVPEAFHVRTSLPRVVADERKEVSVLGFPLATQWWGLLLGVYVYALPIVLYCAWVSIAMWDLARQDAVPNGRRAVWMIVVLAVPVLGPVGYFALGRSPIQPALRFTLVVGGLLVYAALAALAFALAT
jgi:hypothetical protein